MAEELVGTITHYFAKPSVGVVKLTGDIKVGDRVHIQGNTTDFEQEVSSMEVEHGKVESASAGDEVAIKVDERVRHHDKVFKIIPD